MATKIGIKFMKQNILETLIGFIVIIITALFFMYAYHLGKGSQSQEGYLVKAQFQNAEGIVAGSDVMLAGIKVGTVEGLTLDKDSFFAVLSIKLDKEIKLPKDSQAAVATSGFLGSKFIAITPGAGDDELKPGDQIKYTQSSINIEALLGKFMYSFNNK